MWEARMPFELVPLVQTDILVPGGIRPQVLIWTWAQSVMLRTAETVLVLEVFLGPSSVARLKTDPNGPAISKFGETSRSGARTVKETREAFFFSPT